MMNRILLFAGVLLAFTPALHAQIQVGLRVTRRLFVVYEPVVATLQIANLTGRDITLEDADGQNWLGFRIRSGEDRLVPPRDLDYKVGPITIGAGQTLKRSVNLVALYPITDMGIYRVQATVYFPELKQFFTSALANVEITDGKLMWQQTVGVPEGQPNAGEYRTFSILSFRQPKDNMLYVRTEDEKAGIIYSTYPVARILTDDQPQYLLDVRNQLHILQLVGPKTFTYTQIGLNGQLLSQGTYIALKTRPHLRKNAAGNITVVGGQQDIPLPPNAGGPPTPKLSDRPPGMPKIETPRR